jgi:hypothetical protein
VNQLVGASGVRQRFAQARSGAPAEPPGIYAIAGRAAVGDVFKLLAEDGIDDDTARFDECLREALSNAARAHELVHEALANRPIVSAP